MDSLENILSQGLVQRLGWTLLHFVWQAAVVALLLAILLKLLRKSSANLRYIVACLALVIVVLLPAITMNLIPVTMSYSVTEFEPEPAAITSTPVTIEQLSNIEAPVIETQHPVENVTASQRLSFRQRITEAIEPFLPYLVLVWLVGVFGLSVWHLGGWTQLQRLRRRMVKPVDEPLRSKLKELAGILGVHRAVKLMESALVKAPIVVGWLKPVILLPASVLTGFSTDQLEAILAHELAHIKRYDYLVNMLQTVVEILGFYHPAVWWVSYKIRIERENCCDDIAVRVSGDSIGYAKTLASFEEIQAGRPELAVAAGGGSLFERICRLVGKDSAARNRPNWVPAIITMILLVGIVVPAALALSNKLKNKTEPSAVDLVRAVRESENWIHRVDSFYLRMESNWTKTPRGQDKINNEYKERFSGIALDPNRFPDLKPTRYDVMEFAQDHKRILYMKKDPDYWTQKKIWDGQKYMVHEKYFSSPQEHYVLDNALKDHFQMWLETYTSWLRSQPHSYWWNKKDTSKAMKSFGLAENFELKGETDYKGIGCYILEYDWDKSREFKSYRVNRWYVGTKDHLLYGNMRLQHNKPEVEHFTMDYRQVTPGCWFPMNQGYKLYDLDKSGEAYLAITRQFKILDIRINQPLADKLFQMELTPGVKVVDYRNGEPKTYTYVKPIPSLKGAALADLSQVGIKVPLDTFKDKAILVCFWDMQQRPSRHCLRELAKKTEELKQKDIVVVAVQASKIDKNKLNKWLEENKIGFPVGMVEADERKTKFSWGVKSLPWLILTDKSRIVRAEGFSIDEVDEKTAVQVEGNRPEGTALQQAYFGPVIELVVNTEAKDNNQFADLDTGKLYAAPDSLRGNEEMQKWVSENGIDVFAEPKVLMGFDLLIIPEPNKAWEKVPYAHLKDELFKTGRGASISVMEGHKELPATYIFKTREGLMGILQITKATTEAIHIRYRKMQKREKPAVQVEVESKQATSKPVVMAHTGRPLDIAIDGHGYFKVISSGGNEYYTRHGGFGLSPYGEIILMKPYGLMLEPAVTVPTLYEKIDISSDGTATVTVGGGGSSDISQIPLYRFMNPEKLNHIGRNLFSQTDASGPENQGQPGDDGFGRLVQGFLEHGIKDTFKNTGRTLDVVILGRGLFGLDFGDDKVAFTRYGKFHVNQNGEVVWASPNGPALMPPLTLPEGYDNVSISYDGVVSVDIGGQTGDIGRILLYGVSYKDALRYEGNHLFHTTEASGDIFTTNEPGSNYFGILQSGFLEGSSTTSLEPNFKTAVQVEAKTAESAEKLKKLNTAILMYANDYDNKYPDDIQALRSFLGAEDLNWLLIHIKYLGKGKTSYDLPTIPLAYDRTPAAEKPTNVLFNNNRVEFVTPERLRKLGISRAEIQIEVRYLTVGETFLKDIGFDPNSIYDANAWPALTLEVSPAADGSKIHAVLIDQPKFDFFLRAARADKDAAMLTTPRVTVLDGENAEFSVHSSVHYISGYSEPNLTSEKPVPKHDSIEQGNFLKVKPKLSLDDKTIDLDFESEVHQLLGFEELMYRGKYPYKIPQLELVTTKTRCPLPNGQTLLIAGQKITVKENDRKVNKTLIILLKAKKVDSENLPTYRGGYGGYPRGQTDSPVGQTAPTA